MSEHRGSTLPLTLGQTVKSDVLDVTSRPTILVANDDLVGANGGTSMDLAREGLEE